MSCSSFSALIQACHDAACARGEDGYIDPFSGLFVMTSDALARRGECCEKGCRHCPYEQNQDKS